MKYDYIQGYLTGLYKVFKQQVLSNGYELALQIQEVVKNYMEDLSLISDNDTYHKVNNHEAYYSGYKRLCITNIFKICQEFDMFTFFVKIKRQNKQKIYFKLHYLFNYLAI